MGQGTTRVVENNGADDRVRELGTEISDVRRRRDALVMELDRRRHNVTDWRRHLRRHGRTIAVGVLVVAVAVTVPVALARRRARYHGTLVSRGADLARTARRQLGQALGHVADKPDCPAPTQTALGLGSRTAVAVATVIAQALAASVLPTVVRHRGR
jgi:hypothetical protein